MRTLIACSFLSLISLCSAQTPNETKLDYTISLADAAQHRVHVTMSFDPESGGSEVQLPVWNALYQVRDFAKNVLDVKASASDGTAIPIVELDKTTWQVHPKGGWVNVDYDIVLDDPAPFGAQFNEHHAFLNFAEVLMYLPGGRDLPIGLKFANVPANWKLAISISPYVRVAQSGNTVATSVFRAKNYDGLVDTPAEFGQFAEKDFDEGGAHYRVVVDAAPGDYDAGKLVAALEKITRAETEWMNDRPFDSYLFIYHFPRGPAGGGMEHAYSTAISMPADSLKEIIRFESVSAHEFFHLWNVKRIRPQTLEPVDYSRENYTRALWFSEGVTSTVADLALLKAGLLAPQQYFDRVAGGITGLEARPAHLTQSAEESSLDTWLDKYPSYREPDRSISYYNKGELLGILLDLKILEDSRGRYSLRNLFQAMNRDYAKQGKFFDDPAGVRAEAEKLTHTDLHDFFDRYVAGLDELPYQQLFATAGLDLEQRPQTVGDPGFTTSSNFSGPVVIDHVYGSSATAAGLREGQDILAIDGKPISRGVGRLLAQLKPGSQLGLTVLEDGARKDVEIAVGSRQVTSYSLRPSASATQEQLARRAAWLNSEDEPAHSALR